MSDERLIEIEIKVLHQDKLLEELHQALYAQQKTIDRLQVQLDQISKRLEASSDSKNEIGPANEKPPHY